MTEDQRQWYAIRSKPRKEDFLFQQLVSRNIEAFYPKIRVKPVNPRSRRWVPYFPGYMFVHINLEKTGIRPMNRIPGSIGLVMFGQRVPALPEAALAVIKVQVAAMSDSEGRGRPEYRHGSQIKIIHGSFKGYEALFDAQLQGQDRVRVLLKMLSDRLVAVELESDAITLLSPDKKSPQ
jgi:transcription antitermination factor NusG